MKSKFFPQNNLEKLLDKSYWQLEKNEHYIKDIDIALIARLSSACIENDMELDLEVVSKCLYGNYKKDKLKLLIDQGYELYKEIKQQYSQKHGVLRIKQ